MFYYEAMLKQSVAKLGEVRAWSVPTEPTLFSLSPSLPLSLSLSLAGSLTRLLALALALAHALALALKRAALTPSLALLLSHPDERLM